MHNERDMYQEITGWRDDERFYRAYYFAVRNNESPDDILQMPGIGEEERHWAQHPETIDPAKTERDFFNDGRNVQFIKHPRYFPLFFHKHTFFEIIYVLEGTCMEYTGVHGEGNEKIVDADDRVYRSVELKKGDLFLISPGVRHGIAVFHDNSTVINILIRQSTFMDIFLNTVKDKSRLAAFFLGNLYEKDRFPYMFFRTGEDPKIREYVLDMLREEAEQDEYSDRIVCAMLTVFFNRLNRSYANQAVSGKSAKEISADQAAILDYIIQNYRTVTLQELAKTFHFSIPYCSKLVSSITGSSFQNLVSGIRLQQGENLLAHTQLSIEKISEETGYKNPETFIRAFQRYYGMTPGRYRKSKHV